MAETLSDALAVEEERAIRDQFRDRDRRELVPIDLVICQPDEAWQMEVLEAVQRAPRKPAGRRRHLVAIAADVIIIGAALALVIAALADL